MHTSCSFRGSAGYNESDFLDVIEELGAGRFPGIERTITRRISLDDAVEKGFEALLMDMDNHIKIIISPK
jgi:(R,R)-butanediol dehydrogenase/meso-butanediol dehydrogenase/diacetyl reductase